MRAADVEVRPGPADRGLVAFAQQTIGDSLRAVTWVYRSTDGRHWKAIHDYVAVASADTGG
jgi:hypothetical protein